MKTTRVRNGWRTALYAVGKSMDFIATCVSKELKHHINTDVCVHDHWREWWLRPGISCGVCSPSVTGGPRRAKPAHPGIWPCQEKSALTLLMCEITRLSLKPNDFKGPTRLRRKNNNMKFTWVILFIYLFYLFIWSVCIWSKSEVTRLSSLLMFSMSAPKTETGCASNVIFSLGYWRINAILHGCIKT